MNQDEGNLAFEIKQMKELSDAGSMPVGSGILEEGKHQGEMV